MKTGYDFTRNFFDWCFENPDLIGVNDIALFNWLIEKNNRCGWSEKFSVTATENMAACGFKTYPPYKKAFDNLIALGFIILVKKSFNQHQSNIIALSKINKATTKALDKALLKHSIKHVESKQESTFDINKQINKKQETIKPLNNYQLFIDAYNEFCKKILGVPAKINGAEGNAMKSIIAYIEKVSEQKKSVPVDSWQFILDSFNKWEPFHQKQIKLTQINSNLPNIINSIKNGNKQPITAHQQNLNDLADLSARAREAKAALAGQI